MTIQTIAIAIVAWAGVFGLVSSWVAARRERARPLWFGFGAILGPVAVILIWLAPRGYCPVCLTPGRGWLTTCWWCGSALRGSAKPRPRPAAPTAGSSALPPASASPHPAALPPASASPPAAAVSPPAPPKQPEPVGVMDPAIVSEARPARRRRRRRDPAADQPTGTVAEAAQDVTESAALDVTKAPFGLASGGSAVPDPVAEHRSRATTSSGAIRVEPTSLTAGTPAASNESGPAATTLPDTAAAIASATGTPRTSAGAPAAEPIQLPAPEPIFVSTAVYFAGSPRLEIGARYGLVIEGSRFKVVGPYDPSIVAFDRPLAGLAATVNLGRVLLAFPDGRDSIALVFTALAGATPPRVVEILLKAAEQARQ